MALFKVMTWNIESFFRPPAAAAADDQARYTQKVALLAAVITRLAPDVIGLQEVGGGAPMDDLQAALNGAYPHLAISAFDDGRHIRVAFLSKQAIEAQEDIVNFPEGPALDIHDLTGDGASVPVTRMSRGALRIHISIAGQGIDLITTHLKSKLLSFPRPGGNTSFAPRNENERAQIGGIALLKREAEAVTLRMRINSLLVDNALTPLMLMGDLNDVPDAQTTLLLSGPPGSEIGTRGFDIPDNGDDARLFNLAPLIPEATRYSRITNGRKELIDHILASEELLPFEGDHRRRPIVETHADFEVQGVELPSVTANPTTRAKAVGPDHAPVTAIFNL